MSERKDEPRAGFWRETVARLPRQAVACTAVVALSGCSVLLDGGDGVAASPPQPDASPPGACDGQLVNFEDRGDGYGEPLTNYQGIDFRGQWASYPAFAFENPSAGCAFAQDTGIRTFEFADGPKLLRSIRILRDDGPITLNFGNDQEEQQTGVLSDSQSFVDVTFQWTEPSKSITVRSNRGWNFLLDDICFSDP